MKMDLTMTKKNDIILVGGENMRKKFRFINDGNYYTAFENNSIIEIELEEGEKFDRERNYIGYGISKNTGCDTFN